MTQAIGNAGRALLLAAMLVFALAPFEWMLVASLKPGADQLIFGNPWLAWPPDFSNYAGLLASPIFQRWLANTLLVLFGTLALSLAASLLAAYALAHLRVRFSRNLVLALFVTYLLPQGVIFLPLTAMISGLGLLNSPLALVLTYPGLIIPFGTWVLWNFLQSLPDDYVDQARVEGARELQVLLRIVGPLALPALAAVALFGVAIVLNDYLYAFAFESEPAGQTITAAVAATNVDINDSGFLFAAVLLGVAPVAVFCAFFADLYARGLGTGIVND